jgi:hypothetical protein
MEIRLKYAESLFLVVIGAVSVLFLVLSREYSAMARSVPNICAVFALLTIGFRLWQIWIRDSLRGSVLRIHQRSVPFVLMLAGYTAGVFIIGFILSSLIFVPVCMYWMGQRKITRIAAITAIYVAAVYLVFVVGFRMPLPDSLIGF